MNIIACQFRPGLQLILLPPTTKILTFWKLLNWESSLSGVGSGEVKMGQATVEIRTKLLGKKSTQSQSRDYIYRGNKIKIKHH